jgi:hypothetical protein
MGSRMEKLARDKHSSVTKKKSLMILSPGGNVIKLFSFIADDELEHLSLETLSIQVLEFEGKARANPIGAPFRCFLLG